MRFLFVALTVNITLLAASPLITRTTYHRSARERRDAIRNKEEASLHGVREDHLKHNNSVYQSSLYKKLKEQLLKEVLEELLNNISPSHSSDRNYTSTSGSRKSIEQSRKDEDLDDKYFSLRVLPEGEALLQDTKNFIHTVTTGSLNIITDNITEKLRDILESTKGEAIQTIQSIMKSIIDANVTEIKSAEELLKNAWTSVKDADEIVETVRKYFAMTVKAIKSFLKSQKREENEDSEQSKEISRYYFNSSSPDNENGIMHSTEKIVVNNGEALSSIEKMIEMLKYFNQKPQTDKINNTNENHVGTTDTDVTERNLNGKGSNSGVHEESEIKTSEDNCEKNKTRHIENSINEQNETLGYRSHVDQHLCSANRTNENLKHNECKENKKEEADKRNNAVVYKSNKSKENSVDIEIKFNKNYNNVINFELHQSKDLESILSWKPEELTEGTSVKPDKLHVILEFRLNESPKSPVLDNKTSYDSLLSSFKNTETLSDSSSADNNVPNKYYTLAGQDVTFNADLKPSKSSGRNEIESFVESRNQHKSQDEPATKESPKSHSETEEEFKWVESISTDDRQSNLFSNSSSEVNDDFKVTQSSDSTSDDSTESEFSDISSNTFQYKEANEVLKPNSEFHDEEKKDESF
ncbi:uncharacterized protein [Periplaneta americana]|uniref:uncharacterized protein n=1 Tax=Periplaneta americana TaxID=6978 RepID=UPI0037E947C0